MVILRFLPTIIFVLLGFSGLTFSTTAACAPRILVMGDSLSAAYGIEQSKGWVALLQQQLRDEDYPHELINLSVSGETTAGGMRRLPAALDTHGPELMLLELGANDGLRGQSLDKMQQNLEAMIRTAKAAGTQVILFEMRIPPNYGQRYALSFKDRFAAIAQAQDVTLLPFFLTPIALDKGAFQEDGIHPTAEVQDQLQAVVWSALKPKLNVQAGQTAASN